MSLDLDMLFSAPSCTIHRICIKIIHILGGNEEGRSCSTNAPGQKRQDKHGREEFAHQPANLEHSVKWNQPSFYLGPWDRHPFGMLTTLQLHLLESRFGLKEMQPILETEQMAVL
jgi:hypothetical protein